MTTDTQLARHDVIAIERRARALRAEATRELFARLGARLRRPAPITARSPKAPAAA